MRAPDHGSPRQEVELRPHAHCRERVSVPGSAVEPGGRQEPPRGTGLVVARDVESEWTDASAGDPVPLQSAGPPPGVGQTGRDISHRKATVTLEASARSLEEAVAEAGAVGASVASVVATSRITWARRETTRADCLLSSPDFTDASRSSCYVSAKCLHIGRSGSFTRSGDMAGGAREPLRGCRRRRGLPSR